MFIATEKSEVQFSRITVINPPVNMENVVFFEKKPGYVDFTDMIRKVENHGIYFFFKDSPDKPKAWVFASEKERDDEFDMIISLLNGNGTHE